MNKHLPTNTIALAGRLFGFAAAAAADYLLIPRLAEQTGRLAVAIIAGLVVGALIVAACGEASRRLADALWRRRSPARGGYGHERARRLPSVTHVITALMVLILIATLFGEALPPGVFRHATAAF